MLDLIGLDSSSLTFCVQTLQTKFTLRFLGPAQHCFSRAHHTGNIKNSDFFRGNPTKRQRQKIKTNQDEQQSQTQAWQVD